MKSRVGCYVVDERWGLCGRYSLNARQLICLAAGSWSDDIAAQRIEEFCGLNISDTTLREVSPEPGAQSHVRLRTEPLAVKEFRATTGDVEFTTAART